MRPVLAWGGVQNRPGLARPSRALLAPPFRSSSVVRLSLRACLLSLCKYCTLYLSVKNFFLCCFGAEQATVNYRRRQSGNEPGGLICMSYTQAEVWMVLCCTTRNNYIQHDKIPKFQFLVYHLSLNLRANSVTTSFLSVHRSSLGLKCTPHNQTWR